MLNCRVCECVLLCLTLSVASCIAQSVTDDNYEEGYIVNVINVDPDIPSEWQQRDSPPLPIVIWICLVLGIFFFMAISVCCAFFCKYSGKLSSRNHPDLSSPIPIIITPPSRRQTLNSIETETISELSFSNQGYSYYVDTNEQSSAPVSPTSDVPPGYLDLKPSVSQTDPSVKLETPPPMYVTVAPFQ